MSVDEEAIKRSVLDRVVDIKITQNWTTPSGRRRSSPSFEATVQNAYLGESRDIKAKTFEEAAAKCREQHNKWIEKEFRGRVRDAREREIAAQRADAAAAAGEAQQRIESLRNLLRDALASPAKLDWQRSYVSTDAQRFEEPSPQAPAIDEPALPPVSFFERLFPFVRRWRELDRRRIRAMHSDHRTDTMRAWLDQHASWSARAAHYGARAAEFAAERRRANRRVDEMRLAVAFGDRTAIHEYMGMCFAARGYPASFPVSRMVDFDSGTRSMTIDLRLPSLGAVSRVKDVKYVKGGSSEAMLSISAHASMYESAVMQVLLRTAHETFSALDAGQIDVLRMNGWVEDTDSTSGLERSQCIVAISLQRPQFNGLQLSKVDPEDCLRSLGAITAGKLSLMKPVAPFRAGDRVS